MSKVIPAVLAIAIICAVGALIWLPVDRAIIQPSRDKQQAAEIRAADPEVPGVQRVKIFYCRDMEGGKELATNEVAINRFLADPKHEIVQIHCVDDHRSGTMKVVIFYKPKAEAAQQEVAAH